MPKAKAKASTGPKVFHVVCDLPNASHSMNGVKFEPHEGRSVKTVDPVMEEHAALFRGIPGFTVTETSLDAGATDPEKEPPAPEKSATASNGDGPDGTNMPPLI